MIIKCEAHAQGTNRRAIVSNRPGAALLPGPTYDEYTARGESENRNQELTRGLCADRLSDHRFLANFFRSIGTSRTAFRSIREPFSPAPAWTRKRCGPRASVIVPNVSRA